MEFVIEVILDKESWWAAAAAAKAEDIMPSTIGECCDWDLNPGPPKEAEMGVAALVSLK